jgi:hypothetical protein
MIDYQIASDLLFDNYDYKSLNMLIERLREISNKLKEVAYSLDLDKKTEEEKLFKEAKRLIIF